MVLALELVLPATRAGLCRVDSMGFSSSCASTLRGVGRLPGFFSTELFCVFVLQSLPTFELHSVGAGDACYGNSAENLSQNFETNVPASGTPRDEAAIDTVPQLQSSTEAERL